MKDRPSRETIMASTVPHLRNEKGSDDGTPFSSGFAVMDSA